MRVEVKIEFKKYLYLMYLLAYKRPIMIFSLVIGLLMIVFSILYFLGFGEIIENPPYYQLIFGLFFIGYLPFSIWYSAKRNFLTQGILQEKLIYDFTTDKIKITGETFNTELDWAKVYKVVELKNWIQIYQSRLIFNLISKESLDVKLKDFRELMKEKNIKMK